jgi:hypothetical protein
MGRLQLLAGAHNVNGKRLRMRRGGRLGIAKLQKKKPEKEAEKTTPQWQPLHDPDPRKNP